MKLTILFLAGHVAIAAVSYGVAVGLAYYLCH